MTTQIVGYRLRNIASGRIVETWGGVWGQCPTPPNPITLSNGDQVCAPEIGVDYSGCVLEEWWMDEPPAPVPQQAPMWAVRVVLKQNNLLDQAQAAIDASEDFSLQTVWEYGNFADRNSPAIASLAEALGMTDTEVDEMFFAAASLTV